VKHGLDCRWGFWRNPIAHPLRVAPANAFLGTALSKAATATSHWAVCCGFSFDDRSTSHPPSPATAGLWLQQGFLTLISKSQELRLSVMNFCPFSITVLGKQLAASARVILCAKA